MVTIFANEYGPYDRTVFGKGMLRNNDSLIPDLSYLTSVDKTLDTINTFQKVIKAPVVSEKSLHPPKKQYYFADGTPVEGIPFDIPERTYVNENGITVYEHPTTAEDIENMKKIIAEVKAGKLK